MWDAFTVDHVIALFRGVLWLIGMSVGAYLCFTNDERRPVITFLGIVCTVGIVFNVFVVATALLILFGVITG